MSGDNVKFGAHVSLVDEETEKEATYQIVGVHEADIKAARLSISSPLAKSLIGKKVGDSISVPAPGGDRSYEILAVRFTDADSQWGGRVIALADIRGRGRSASPAACCARPRCAATRSRAPRARSRR